MAEGNPHKTVKAQQDVRVFVVPDVVAEDLNF